MSKTIRYAIALGLCIVLVLGMSAYAFAGNSGKAKSSGAAEYCTTGSDQYGNDCGKDKKDKKEKKDKGDKGGRSR